MPGITQCEPGVERDRLKPPHGSPLGGQYPPHGPPLEGHYPQAKTHHCEVHSYEMRYTVFAAKRKFKGTKTVITENLTKKRTALLKKAMDN